MAQVTALVENTASGRGILGEHGLSFLIDLDDHRVLLDTGQGHAIGKNAERLRISLSTVDTLILSHGHYDHTGGVVALTDRTTPLPVYLHKAAMQSKFSRHSDGSVQDVSMPSCSRSALLNGSFDIRWTDGPREANAGILVTGEIPRETDYEDTGGDFFSDAECTSPDTVPDDQAVAIHTHNGVVLLLGCAHAGTVNTMNYVAQLLGIDHFRAVVGGMHLLHASDARIEATIEAFRRYDVEMIGPCHCTGTYAFVQMCRALPDRCYSIKAGTTMAL